MTEDSQEDRTKLINVKVITKSKSKVFLCMYVGEAKYKETDQVSVQDLFVIYDRRNSRQESIKITGVNVGFNLDGSRISGYGQGEGSTVPLSLNPDTYRAPSPPLNTNYTNILCKTHMMPEEPATTPHDSSHQAIKLHYGAAYTKLIMRVKKLEHKVKSSQPRRRARVVISDTEKDLENPSKQGRKIAEIDKKSLYFIDQKEPTRTSVKIFTKLSILSTADVFEDEMMTIAESLVAIRRTRTRTTSVVIHDPEPRRTVPEPTSQSHSSYKDKGKEKMIEPDEPVKIKRIDQSCNISHFQSDIAEEQVQTNMALMAFSDSKLNQTEFKAATYKRGLATVEEQLVTYRKNEVLFSEEVAVIKRDVTCKDYEISVLKSEFEKVKQEKEGIEFKIEKFNSASKSLDKLLGSQITNKSKKGLGYHAVPPPHPLIYNAPTKLDLSYSGLYEFKEPEFKGCGPRDSKLESNIVCDSNSDDSKENFDDSLVKEQVSEDTSSFVESPLNGNKETVFPTDKKIEFVKPKNHENPVKNSVRPRVVNTARPPTTVGHIMESDDIEVVDFSTTSPQSHDDEVTLAKTLVNIKMSATKDKGKAIMQEFEPLKKIMKKEMIQIGHDGELAQKLHAEELAKDIAR
ncbi:hypothetical protein Tco_1106745 [Tanacetum coccineum]